MSSLSLELTQQEIEQLKVAVERSLKDAIYFNRHTEERHSRSLIDKIHGAIRERAQYDSMVEEFGEWF
jgi:hypothetical protein